MEGLILLTAAKTEPQSCEAQQGTANSGSFFRKKHQMHNASASQGTHGTVRGMSLTPHGLGECHHLQRDPGCSQELRGHQHKTWD